MPKIQLLGYHFHVQKPQTPSLSIQDPHQLSSFSTLSPPARILTSTILCHGNLSLQSEPPPFCTCCSPCLEYSAQGILPVLLSPSFNQAFHLAPLSMRISLASDFLTFDPYCMQSFPHVVGSVWTIRSISSIRKSSLTVSKVWTRLPRPHKKIFIERIVGQLTLLKDWTIKWQRQRCSWKSRATETEHFLDSVSCLYFSWVDCFFSKWRTSPLWREMGHPPVAECPIE